MMNDLFSKYENDYNFPYDWDRREFFTDLVIEQIKRRDNPAVLDIGCGSGIGRLVDLQYKIRKVAGRYIGLEPDPDIIAPPKLFDEYECALFENTKLPDNSIDVAYSFMVMEHVANPDAFFSKLSKVLKPDGVYIFITVNGSHYFALLTKLFKTLKLDELIVNMVRGKAQTESYHYPVAYKINTIGQINKICSKYNFSRPKFIFTEKKGMNIYLPGVTSVFGNVMNLKRKLFKRKENLLEITCLIKKKA